MKIPPGPLAFLLPLLTVLLMLPLIIRQAPELIHAAEHSSIFISRDSLKHKAFSVLDTKCNVCHRKQNPFMVFSIKNMDRRAIRIDQQVFANQRMHKGKRITLTPEEYQILSTWITSTKHQ